MECQKIINLLDTTPNQLTKFRTKIWLKINNDGSETYNSNSQIKFKTSMLKPSLCDYTDTYILLRSTITVAAQIAGNQNNVRKKVVFKNCAPFTDCISEINNKNLFLVKKNSYCAAIGKEWCAKIKFWIAWVFISSYGIFKIKILKPTLSFPTTLF